MASISSSNTSLPPSWASESNSTSLRDASFSSYLNSTEENFIHSLVESSQNLNHSLTSKHQHHDRPLYNSRQKKVEDGEIDVFSADKYFNGRIDQESNTRSAKYQHQLRKDHTDQQIGGGLSKLKFEPRTPSTQSESSWNSQSALLRRVQRNPSRSNSRSDSQGKRSFLSCYCCDKKAVDIKGEEFDNHGNRDMDGPRHDRRMPRSIKTSIETAEIMRLNKLRVATDPLVFPVSEPLTAAKKTQLEDQEEEEEKRRKSLEVFGSNEEDEYGSKRFSLENKLNLLSWDAIPRSMDEISTSGPPSETCKDTESDASSDLFEIECLSCTANPVVQGPRHTSDGGATPKNAYAPSEASIDWSVVTASAADFSIASDSEDQRSVLTSVTRCKMPPKPTLSTKKHGDNKRTQKPRSTGLLTGCKSLKAVRVAGDNYRSPSKGKLEAQTRHRFSDSFTPMTRFQAEAKLAGFGHRSTKSISGSELLYIQ